MAVTSIDSHRAGALALADLGLSHTGFALCSRAALSEALRRAASFLCPTTPSALADAVSGSVAGLPGCEADLQGVLETLLERLVAYGDLLELAIDPSSRPRRHLFLAPPAYVRRASNIALLVGIRPEGAPLLSSSLSEAIDYAEHVRVIRAPDGMPIADFLGGEDLQELSEAHWLSSPREVPAAEFVRSYDLRLDAAGPSGDIENLRIIDPDAPLLFYRGRWRPPKTREGGRFVGRRPQAFGADLWCYVDVLDGAAVRLVDLPIERPLGPGADEAWRLQAALDHRNGRSHRVRVRNGRQAPVLDFFSPLPSWAQRRLEVIGTSAPRGLGSLFSISLPAAEVVQELEQLARMLWMEVEDEGIS